MRYVFIESCTAFAGNVYAACIPTSEWLYWRNRAALPGDPRRISVIWSIVLWIFTYFAWGVAHFLKFSQHQIQAVVSDYQHSSPVLYGYWVYAITAVGPNRNLLISNDEWCDWTSNYRDNDNKSLPSADQSTICNLNLCWLVLAKCLDCLLRIAPINFFLPC